MPLTPAQIARFLRSVHPYDSLPAEVTNALSTRLEAHSYSLGDTVYQHGAPLAGIYLVYAGLVEISDEHGGVVSHLGLRNSFGERGLLRDGKAATHARCEEDSTLLLLPKDTLLALIEEHDAVRRFFDRAGSERRGAAAGNDLANTDIAIFMARNPITLKADDTVRRAARTMAEAGISSICVIGDDGALQGLVTTGDLVGRVLSQDLSPNTQLAEVMTAAPRSLPPHAIGSDVLHMMTEFGFGHIPVVENGALVGIVTQTDLTRLQAVSSVEMVREITRADTAEDIAQVTWRIPKLLAQLVGSGHRHDIVTRLITDVADITTRRLLTLAEARLGPPPVPYLWLACGSQGRQEQTGVSDQDNCLILDDAVTEEMRRGYFAKLARFVCDGLNTCGYVYCPGDMMATAERWRQPARVWRSYFQGWINTPNPEAQMLASVMFDLRPIAGTWQGFEEMQAETLRTAAQNSIFVAHMASNALKHHPPLGLLRGLVTIKSGEHKHQLDMKHNGVVPVVDLARISALQGQLSAVNTRARLQAASDGRAGFSASGIADLLSAYDLIAEERLNHQLRQIHSGIAPDNFLAPSSLSDFDRSHLRDAFVVIKSLQGALSHGRSASN
ncbi:DUF294 nucleotidyltransferase-like domain-containing protein [Shimia sp. R9_3]|uniref:DUF294 nucleotidyltransferase-like domain-containing protein n=1 Tax=Shimia sp. R9_3 TaxID=2821113 RepID=UPI001ADBCC0C|nr:DUF294 nucleotidyltransferase-like domain-containing protein [Shimia sp. R9_3]MBO9403350.1 CBS domain-containing protein [Shimia sp. R9_3]